MKGIRMKNLEINVPIFRAKWEKKNNITSEEYIKGYVEGYYSEYLDKHYIYTETSKPFGVEIDISTLAINFPSMIDTQGNKIFASLSENGKGGDYTFMQNGYDETFCWDSLNGCIVLKSKHYECRCFRNGGRNETNFNTYKIIGIQE